MTISGWLFDAYTLGDRMVFWVITENGKAVRLEDSWTHSFYVAADDKSDLESIVRDNHFEKFVRSFEFVSKHETIMDYKKSEILKITLQDSQQSAFLASTIRRMGNFGKFRLYNVDLLPAQTYFYEKEIFPLGFCAVESSNGRLTWNLTDDIWSTDYRLPDFTSIHIDINPKKEGKIAEFTDRIDSISIKRDKEKFEIKSESELDIINELVSTVSSIDPDFVFTTDGDSFGFPYLLHRAKENSIELFLSREKVALRPPRHEGSSYFCYGRVYFTPAKVELLGRIHLDRENCTVFRRSGLHGLYEIARVCRMPLHTAFRASIGRCLSSLQFYHATLDEILVPWKPDEAEHIKTLEELFIADRGGLILVPKIGVHEKVAEFDFAALFPNIMQKRNVSAETIRCSCCPDSGDRVPELGVHVCNRRMGIVGRSLDIVIKKRARYKKLKKAAIDPRLHEIYEDRQGEYKWIGVTSFGYLGYNNAKFGRIDSHQAVCAYDRQILLKAVRIAENHGFKILHGIVDSLWVQKDDATLADYLKLREEIEKVTGFDLSFEGEYKWIAFIHSKNSDWIPVPNRYFGVFADGSIKVRGLETRRHDTPPFFAKVQSEILRIMARGNTVDEVKALLPTVEKTFQKYASKLEKGELPIEELVFTKQTSKASAEYQNRNTIENSALNQLLKEGRDLKAGEILQYVVTGYNRKKVRSMPVELLNEKVVYDAKWYIEKLAEVCNSVTEPFGQEMEINTAV